MLKYIKGDLTEIKSGFICQQVNCQGVMGSGLARAIRDKWPKVFDEYASFCKLMKLMDQPTRALLGKNQIVELSAANGLFLCNLFGQDNYGREERRYINYAALFKGLEELVARLKNTDFDIYIPKNIGCGLAHGNWEFVEQYLEDLSEMYNKDIYIVEKL